MKTGQVPAEQIEFLVGDSITVMRMFYMKSRIGMLRKFVKMEGISYKTIFKQPYNKGFRNPFNELYQGVFPRCKVPNFSELIIFMDERTDR